MSKNGTEKATKPKTGTRGIIAVGTLAFLALFCGGGAWLATASLSGAVIARGHVVVDGEPKEVQHLDGGIVSAIAVNDGTQVQKGDIVMRLDDTVPAANVDIYRNRLLEAFARRSRLQAEHLGLDRIRWPKPADLPHGSVLSEDLKSAQISLFEARRKSNAGERHRAMRKIAQFRSQIEGIRAQKTSIRKQRALQEEELAAMQTLYDQGHASPAALRKIRQQIALLEGGYGEAVAEDAKAQAAISETEIAILQNERAFAESVIRDITVADTEISEISQQFHAARKQLARTRIQAPASGLVHRLSVVTVGGVVAAGSSLMQIVPQDRALKISAAIEPRDIDEIRPGQSAVIRPGAYSQRNAPDLQGKIETISATTMVDETTGSAYYKALISVEDPATGEAADAALLPGMPVEVFLVTADRSALNYLIKPALDQINRAMREE